MSDYVFEIIDKTGRKIHLSKERWSHIRARHPNVENSDIIEEAIKNPIKIIHLEKETFVFYKYFKHKKDHSRYLKVLVKYLNGNGYVISSYFVDNMI